MDYLNSTGPSSTSSIYGTLPRTKKREKSKREKRTPEDMAAHIANYVVYKAEPVSTKSKMSQVQTHLNNKRGCVFPMVIWPAFHMGQYRVNDHPYHAPQFNSGF